MKGVLFLLATEGKRRCGSSSLESKQRQVYTGTCSTLLDTQRVGCLSRRWVSKLLKRHRHQFKRKLRVPILASVFLLYASNLALMSEVWHDWLFFWRPTDWPFLLNDVQTFQLVKLTDWLTGWLADWLSDWLFDWLTIRLTGWLFNWLTDWITHSLTHWPSDWLNSLKDLKGTFIFNFVICT